MANKRMISLDIVDTDAFLDMPTSTQLLYFHLSVRADDDGFVSSPKRVARMIGGGDDDIKILISKKFIIPFESGICVIKHWRINNYVRKDIYKETKYIKEKNTLFIRENGAYTFTENGAVPIPKGHYALSDIHVDDTSTLRARERVPSIGKVSIGKHRIVKTGKVKTLQKTQFNKLGAEVIKEFETINPTAKNWYNNKTQRKACDDLIEAHGLQKVIEVINKLLPKTNTMQYMPTITTPLQLRDKWAQLEASVTKKKIEKPKYQIV